MPEHQEFLNYRYVRHAPSPLLQENHSPMPKCEFCIIRYVGAKNLATILSILRESQPRLRDSYGVAAMWVFGSYVRGEQKSTSDVDVLVEFDQPGMTLIRFIDLEMNLSEALGIKVDLVRRSALKPRIRPEVVREAVLV